MAVIKKLTTVLRSARESGHFWRRLFAELLLQTGTTTLFSIKRQGYTLTYFPTALSTTLFVNRHDFVNDEIFLAKYLLPGDVVVDVGSNIGTHTLAAATRVGERGLVIAIEPHPRTFSYLEHNVRRNGVHHVVLMNLALGNRDSLVGFSDRYEDNENLVMESQTAPITVPMRQLDSIEPAPGRSIALLKIDVEGFELPILQGASQTLTRVQAILYEACDAHFARFGYRFAQLLQWLENCGFTSYHLEVRRGHLVPVQREGSLPGCCNLLALRDPAGFCTRTGFTLAPAHRER